MSVSVTKLRNVSSRPPSRCTIPSPQPYVWEHYRAGVNRVAENELEAALEDGCQTQTEYDFRLAEVDALRDRASRGELEVKSRDEDPEIVPVMSYPTLWELRWDFGGRPFRQYHAEPITRPDVLLALLSHWKSVTGAADQIRAAQQAKMSEAARRFANWP
jgi:hypothetical protein